MRDVLLVSAVNGGGVFLVDNRGIERWSRVDTTGIALVPGGVLLARQTEGCAEVRRLCNREVHRIQIVDRSLDLHDVHADADCVYVVATQINTVFEFDHAFAERRHWSMPGEDDSQHVNSVCVHEGRILASRFGPFHSTRGYKERTRGAGEVFDPDTGEVLIEGLSQPHSLLSCDGRLWLCDSETRTLRRYRGAVCEIEHPLDGYTRGLAVGASELYVGLSRSRNAEPGMLDSACIVVLDRERMVEVSRIQLPVDEIYDIRIIAAEAVDDLRAAAFADAVAEYDTLVDARNRAVAAALGEDARLRGMLHRTNLQIDVLETECARLGSRLDLLQRQADADAARIEEDAHWIGMLDAESGRLRDVIMRQGDALAVRDKALAQAAAEQARALAWIRDGEMMADAQTRALRARAAECDALRAAVDAHKRMIAVQSGLIEAHRASDAAIRRSRSWRWTKMFRRSEPTLPDTALPEIPADVPEAELPVLPGLEHYRPGPAPIVPPGERSFDPGPVLSRAVVPIVGLRFDEIDTPQVSIIVPAYGDFARTRACLESIRDTGAAASFEVIVVEDASGEVEMERFALVPGLRYRRNPDNLGFLHSVNAALELARGEFVHLLNNDTRVQSGWLDALLRTFAIFHDCGIAGSKLVYPDGRLQEAGGIVWSDADACNFGRGGDPDDPAFATVREVDYVSGASVLLRTDLMRAIDGFDTRYAPAYYEDTDLSFRLRLRGLKTYFQPASVVVHEEGSSHGTDTAAGGKQWQLRNRGVFRERWHDELLRAQCPPGEHVFLARSRAQLRKTVLIADRSAPQTDRDAGSRAIWQIMRLLYVAGFEVKFWSQQPEDDPRYRELLRMHAIELFDPGCVTGGFEEWISKNGRYFDYVILSRPQVAHALINTVRRHSGARVLYYGHDIHHLRMRGQQELRDESGLEAAVNQIRHIEQQVWRQSDVVLYPSDEETAHVRAWLQEHDLAADTATIPLFAYEDIPLLPDDDGEVLSGRRNVVFVGGFDHAPNEDGIVWFVDNVWPLVRSRLSGLGLVIVGANVTNGVAALADTDIVVKGNLTDAELAAEYRAARIAVAPLRFGAGVKGKVLEALRFGVPCVVTSVGAQGLRDASFLQVGDDSVAMASAIERLAGDDAAWLVAARQGQAFIAERFSPRTVSDVLFSHMDRTPYPDVASRHRRITDMSRSPPS